MCFSLRRSPISDRIYEYKVQGIQLFDGSELYPATAIVDIHYALTPLNQAASGTVGTLTLRLPRNDHEPISSLLERARLEAPKALRAASDLIETHIPEDGKNVRSKDGLGS